MLPIDASNVRNTMLALSLSAIGWLMLAATPAFGTLPVTDPPVEASTAQTALELQQTNRTLSQDLRANTATAQSVTAEGGAGLWRPQGDYLGTLSAHLNQGIATSDLFTHTFPGWKPLQTPVVNVSQSQTALSMNTYLGAFAIARQQLIDLPAADNQLANIEQQNQSIRGILQGLRLVVETVMTQIQEDQRLRQLVATLVIMQAVHDGEDLQERAAVGATTAATLKHASME